MRLGDRPEGDISFGSRLGCHGRFHSLAVELRDGVRAPRAPQGQQPSKLAPYGEDDGEAVNPMKLVKLKIVTGPSVWRFAGVGTRSSLR